MEKNPFNDLRSDFQDAFARYGNEMFFIFGLTPGEQSKAREFTCGRASCLGVVPVGESGERGCPCYYCYAPVWKNRWGRWVEEWWEPYNCLKQLYARAGAALPIVERKKIPYEPVGPVSWWLSYMWWCKPPNDDDLRTPDGMNRRCRLVCATPFLDSLTAIEEFDLGRREKKAGAHGQLRFTLVGEYWAIEYMGETARLKDSVGIRRLARLLQRPNPQKPDSAIDLLQVDGGGSPGTPTGEQLDPDRVLDEQAVREITKELAETVEKIALAEEDGDHDRVRELEASRSALDSHLASATGLNRRIRALGKSPAERAANTVKTSLGREYERFAQQGLTGLVSHLDTTIAREGNAFAYRPDPGVPTWQF